MHPNELTCEVLRALIEIQRDDTARYTQEMAAFHADLTHGRHLPMGSLYFAAMAELPGYVKISCTRDRHPALRLQELSQYTPTPLTLVAWIPTNNPFFLEHAVHASLDDMRAFREPDGSGDACTEFFRLERAEEYAHALRVMLDC